MPRTYVNYIVNIFIIVIITQLLLVIIFNSKFCNQVDGVAMGSPLAAILANIFMAFFLILSGLMNIFLTNLTFI